MKLIFTFLLAVPAIGIKAQPPDTPPEIRSFIIPGYEVLDYISGDLNSDKRKDAILLLKSPGEDSLSDQELSRPFLLLVRQANGKLKQVLRNDSAIMCRQCGGVFGDPYAGITLKPGGFILNFYGGSSWRWGYEYQFGYKAASGTWLLQREKQTSFQSGDPDATMKNTTIPASETGAIPLEKFNCNPGYEGSRWKVTAAKTFFYDSPLLGSKPRKAYLLKGNMAEGIRRFKNFVEVSFDDGKDNISTGFILRKDLQEQ